MTRIWFASELETVATYWQIHRADGVALGFSTHDADLWFDGLLHQSAPGVMPAAIRRSGGFDVDSAEVSGAITHEAISADDLNAGRYENARITVGLVDWETLEHTAIYSGSIGTITQEDNRFSAQLQSRKSELARNPVPATSPCCRASFCDVDCGLSAPMFTHEDQVSAWTEQENAVSLSGSMAAALLVGGTIRWLDGPYAGMAMGVVGDVDGALVLDAPLDHVIASGTRVLVTQGCDHTLPTCSGRFGNAVNFRGEPFLPGNDMVVRYGLSQ